MTMRSDLLGEFRRLLQSLLGVLTRVKDIDGLNVLGG